MRTRFKDIAVVAIFYVEYLSNHPISEFVDPKIMISKQLNKEVIYCEPDDGATSDEMKDELVRAYEKAGFEIKRIIRL